MNHSIILHFKILLLKFYRLFIIKKFVASGSHQVARVSDICYDKISQHLQNVCSMNISFNVNTNSVIESNKFLLSLWNEMNHALSPEQNQARVPWYYAPYRFLDKNFSETFIGDINTRIGNLSVSIRYKKKGNIDTFIFTHKERAFSDNEKSLLKDIVRKAVKNKDKTSIFTCLSVIDAQSVSTLPFGEYHGNNIHIINRKDGKSQINFDVVAIDRYEAENTSFHLMTDLCAFLSVETNTLCSFPGVQILDFAVDRNKNGNKNKYFEDDDYIDGCSYDKTDGVLRLSEKALWFIESYILKIERFRQKTSTECHFISACKHVTAAIETEHRQFQDIDIKVVDEDGKILNTSKGKAQVRNIREQEYITSALMSYMSAMECVTVGSFKPETCKECGNLKYKIAHRVKDLAIKYLGINFGKIYSDLYSYRSKFLHEGKFATDMMSNYNIPMIDPSTGTCFVNFLEFSMFNGNHSFGCCINNIREWTTYILRRYYKETDFSIKNCDL